MADKEFEPDDPLELVGVALPEAGARAMAECLVEEYIRDGWGDAELMGLFKDPFYRLPHRIYREEGPAYVQGLIAALRRKWGYWRGDDVASRLRVDEIKKRLVQQENRHV